MSSSNQQGNNGSVSMSVPVTEGNSRMATGDKLFTPAEIEQFEREGYFIAHGLGDEELCSEMLAATYDGLGRESGPVEYEAELHYPGAPGSLNEVGGHTIRRLKQAHCRHFVFTEWVSRPALVGRLQQLLGPEVVMPLAHHNCIMTKQPHHSSDTGWHQDIRYWAFEQPKLVSVWLALGDEVPENGCLRLIPGTHRMTFDSGQFDAAQFLRADLERNRELISRSVTAELKAGDVLFFHSRLFHAADRNSTENPKFSVVFTFRSGDSRPIPGTRSASLPEFLIASGLHGPDNTR